MADFQALSVLHGMQSCNEMFRTGSHESVNGTEPFNAYVLTVQYCLYTKIVLMIHIF